MDPRWIWIWKWLKYCAIGSYYCTNSVFVKHILLHIRGSWPIRVRFLHPWAVGHPALWVFKSWFLVCYSATQLANQLHQTRIQVVRSNKVARKRLTESNGTPAMDLGHMNVVLKYSQSHLGWHFRMLFQSSKLKARTSLFTVTWQKRLSSSELWAFENVNPSAIGRSIIFMFWE